MNEVRMLIVKVFMAVWAVGLLIILIGGFVVGVQTPDTSLEWLKTYLSGTTAIFMGIVGYYFGAISKK